MRAFATHHGLLGLAKRMPSRCQPDDGLGHDDPGRRDGPDDRVHGDRLRRGSHFLGSVCMTARAENAVYDCETHVVLLQRCTWDGYERVDGERLWMFRQPPYLPDQPYPILVLFPQTQDSTGTDLDPSVPHGLERAQTVLVRTGGDHRRVEFSGGVQVVVVSGETGFFESTGLVRGQHA